jgi:endo-alpha-1,4-polygalactosaminidase (GH114 family)
VGVNVAGSHMKTSWILMTLLLLPGTPLVMGGNPSWGEINSWVYQLCDYKDGKLDTWSFAEPKPNRKYLDAIDGIGIESVFYIAHDRPAKQTWCEENRKNALAIKQAGKKVFGVDYAKKRRCIEEAYKKLRGIGFVPYVSVRELNVIVPENPVR